MPNDRARSSSGVVCSVTDIDQDKVRLIFDDVANDKQSTVGVWKHHSVVTWKDYERADFEGLKLSDKELADLGSYLIARLVALRKHPLTGK